MYQFHHLIINTVYQNGKNAWKFYYPDRTGCFDGKTTEFLRTTKYLKGKTEIHSFFFLFKSKEMLSLGEIHHTVFIMHNPNLGLFFSYAT